MPRTRFTCAEGSHHGCWGFMVMVMVVWGRLREGLGFEGGEGAVEPVAHHAKGAEADLRAPAAVGEGRGPPAVGGSHHEASEPSLHGVDPHVVPRLRGGIISQEPVLASSQSCEHGRVSVSPAPPSISTAAQRGAKDSPVVWRRPSAGRSGRKVARGHLPLSRHRTRLRQRSPCDCDHNTFMCKSLPDDS